ncbi:MAG: hypothetical protein Q7R97_03300 [Candidatus Daviesbacteria bacterium]|nr:hypothetical protein [Candidatus Daviesbacteria bacterium]
MEIPRELNDIFTEIILEQKSRTQSPKDRFNYRELTSKVITEAQRLIDDYGTTEETESRDIIVNLGACSQELLVRMTPTVICEKFYSANQTLYDCSGNNRGRIGISLEDVVDYDNKTQPETFISKLQSFSRGDRKSKPFISGLRLFIENMDSEMWPGYSKDIFVADYLSQRIINHQEMPETVQATEYQLYGYLKILDFMRHTISGLTLSFPVAESKS